MTHIDKKPDYKDWLTLPLSVALAGLFIGAGIYLGLSNIGGMAVQGTSAAVAVANPTAGAVAAGDPTDVKVPAVTSSDHIRGNAKAKVMVVEYSDLECPFCKQFHASVKTALAKFKSDEVAWVYRHYPLDAIHPNARKMAEATECAAELGGNDAFWKFTDAIFEQTPAGGKFSMTELPNIAQSLGLSRSAFESCLSSGKYAKKVEEQYQGGITAGVRGTPHSILITAKGNSSVGGAVPAETLENAIRAALTK